jgi:hypothetical protein
MKRGEAESEIFLSTSPSFFPFPFGSSANYDDNIWPIIDQLPNPLLPFLMNSFNEIRENFTIDISSTIYLPRLVNVVCECLLLIYISFFAQSDENQRKGAKAIARSRGVYMIVDHLSSSLNLFRIVTQI